MTADPARFLLAEGWNRQSWDRPEPDVHGTGPEVPLDAHVAEWRARIEAGRTKEPQDVEDVVISAERAEVIACLLRELAARLRPGPGIGPIRSDGSLAQLAHDLEQDLDSRAW